MDSFRSSSLALSRTDTTNSSIVDRNSHFDGLYKTTADLMVEGRANGEIQCEGTVTVAEGASVEATISARTVVIAGTAAGQITCIEQFILKPTGRITGKVTAASIMVEEGAFFEGEFRMAQGSGGSFDSFTSTDDSLGSSRLNDPFTIDEVGGSSTFDTDDDADSLTADLLDEMEEENADDLSVAVEDEELA